MNPKVLSKIQKYKIDINRQKMTFQKTLTFAIK